MSITIHPELEARLRARAETEGLSVEAYVERIARDDEQTEQELEMTVDFACCGRVSQAI